MASEPGRLWRRYLIGNPRFVLSAARHHVGTRAAVKVLVAHNRYRSEAPSGENKVVDAEIGLLRQVASTSFRYRGERQDRHQGATCHG